MTDLITDEIVEAAARAIIAAQQSEWLEPGSEWTLDRLKVSGFLQDARAALTAALPMLVRAEREACAQVADAFGKPYSINTADGAMMFRAVTDKIATAIRSRGEA